MPGSAATVDRVGASERIRKAAIALFRARGYHGTPVRVLARVVRLEAASLYYHFPSKQEILGVVFTRVMDDLLDGLRRATEGATRPEERLRAAVRYHVLFHIERQDEAFISHSELRSLTGPNVRRVIAKRDRYEAMFRALLVAGMKTRAFDIRDVRLMTISILTMCSGVADWFTRPGRLGAEAVADAYAEMVQRLVGRGGDLRAPHLASVRPRVPVPRPRPARPRRGP
jgi:AcrR family transcriptional regulator